MYLPQMTHLRLPVLPSYTPAITLRAHRTLRHSNAKEGREPQQAPLTVRFDWPISNESNRSILPFLGGTIWSDMVA
jgi:hypothetical protein